MKVILLVLDALGLRNEQSFGTLNRILKHTESDNIFKYLDICSKKVQFRTLNDINIVSTYITPSTLIPDSYLGHCEMIDAQIDVQEVFIDIRLYNKLSFLSKYGKMNFKNGVITVGNKFVIGNNGECQPGLNLNILWLTKPDLNEFDMDDLAYKLLETSNCTRVIQMWGNEIVLERVYDTAIISRSYLGESYNFLCIPPLDIYNDNYQVKHYGKKATQKNLLEKLLDNNIHIELIGKVGKMFNLDGNPDINYTGIETQKIMDELTLKLVNLEKECFIFCNIQEIDLAGHEQDVVKAANVLEKISDRLYDVMKNIGDEDIVIVTADHGNDPLDGSPFHSYEDVPLIILSKKEIKVRQEFGKGLNEISKSIERIFKLEMIGEGLFYYEN
ncbi:MULTISPECIES: hypothetical protein [unclassified Streptococcus]|uniref:hypothetical protein n=1 Tax=unclassified Streptococcus TaxID=2608887 RepID=UPI00359EFD0E